MFINCGKERNQKYGRRNIGIKAIITGGGDVIKITC